jgi:hypothetical protein
MGSDTQGGRAGPCRQTSPTGCWDSFSAICSPVVSRAYRSLRSHRSRASSTSRPRVRRPTRQFHGLPSDSFPYTLTCQPMAAGRHGDTARAAEGHSRQPGRCQPGSRAGAGPPQSRSGTAASLLILPSAPRQFGQSGGPQAGWKPLRISPARVGGRGAEARGSRRCTGNSQLPVTRLAGIAPR